MYHGDWLSLRWVTWLLAAWKARHLVCKVVNTQFLVHHEATTPNSSQKCFPGPLRRFWKLRHCHYTEARNPFPKHLAFTEDFRNIIDWNWTMERINKLCCQWLVYKKYLSIKPIKREFTILNDECKVSVQRERTFAAEGFSGCSQDDINMSSYPPIKTNMAFAEIDKQVLDRLRCYFLNGSSNVNCLPAPGVPNRIASVALCWNALVNSVAERSTEKPTTRRSSFPVFVEEKTRMLGKGCNLQFFGFGWVLKL